MKMQTDTQLWRSGERAQLEVSGEASRVLSQEHSSGAETPRVGFLKAVSPTGDP